MGLSITHDCWDGAYSEFNRFRNVICNTAGLGDIYSYDGFGGCKNLDKQDHLTILLNHSDCDGDISSEDCFFLAKRLSSLLPSLNKNKFCGGQIGYIEEKTRIFIDGLMDAHEKCECVEFL